VDYKEVFALVSKIEIIRLVISIARRSNWSFYHLDVKSKFLNGPLGEEIFVIQPPGFEQKGKYKVYKLNKTLYDLKQAPKCYNKRIASFFY